MKSQKGTEMGFGLLFMPSRYIMYIGKLALHQVERNLSIIQMVEVADESDSLAA